MKKLKIIGLTIISFITIIIIFIFILRFYNDKKYGNKDLIGYKYYKNLNDIDKYPKNIEKSDIKYVDKGFFQGFHIIPHNKIYKGVVVFYGGSEGGANFEQAERLAKEGYETLSVFMFGMKNQPKTLSKIPLEQFEDVLKYINENIKNKTPITVLGVSKGAEYALNLATKYEEISNLILIAPSSYTFFGLDFNDYGSSWTYKNKELPFVDIKKSPLTLVIKNIFIPMLIKYPVKYREIYSNAIKNDYYKPIPVENIKSDILLIAGEDDQVWESYEMSNIIKSKNPNAIIVSYKDAGHIFWGDGVLSNNNIRIKTGGTLEGNKKASIDSKNVIDNFLKKHHT